MAPIRTTQFYLAVPPVVGGVDTWTIAYTVPAGKRIILKDTLISNNAGVTRTVSVRIDGSIQIFTTNLVSLGTDHRSFWTVLNAGQTLGVFQRVGGGVSYALSGALLYV